MTALDHAVAQIIGPYYSFFSVFFMLLAGHALADFALQSDFLAHAKNRNTEIGKVYWMHALPAHALIHGGCVVFASGSVVLGVAETLCHATIDLCKCENKFNLHIDQLLHILCKVAWAYLSIE